MGICHVQLFFCLCFKIYMRNQVNISPNILSFRPRLGAKRDTKERSSYSDEEDAAAAAAAAAALSVSPPSLLSLPSFKDVGNEKGGEKEVWVSVFKYMSRAELLSCMLVCKAWYKW